MLLLVIEVKPEEAIKTNPGVNNLVHLAQVRSDFLIEFDIVYAYVFF